MWIVIVVVVAWGALGYVVFVRVFGMVLICGGVSGWVLGSEACRITWARLEE